MSKDGVPDTLVDIVPRLQDERAEIGIRYRVLRHNQPPTHWGLYLPEGKGCKQPRRESGYTFAYGVHIKTASR